MGSGSHTRVGWFEASRRSLVAGWVGCAVLSCTHSRSLPDSGKAASSTALPSTTSPVGSAAPSSIASPALAIVNAEPGAFTLRAERALQVRTAAQLERRNPDGSWVPDPSADGARGYQLSDTCSAAPPPACRSLRAGERLVPLPWSGDDCAAQCGKPCEPERYQSGVHRLVVLTCAAPHERFEGPAFEMPASAQALARLRAASDVEHVRAARLKGTDFRLTPGVIEAGRIAGLKEVSGTSQELSPELATELLKWLRSEAGFRDHVVSRCAPGIRVGFVLTHETIAGIAQRTDLSIDLSCRRLDIAQNGEDISFALFDPSRELIAVLRQVFPNDQPLKREMDRELIAVAGEHSQAAQPSAAHPD